MKKSSLICFLSTAVIGIAFPAKAQPFFNPQLSPQNATIMGNNNQIIQSNTLLNSRQQLHGLLWDLNQSQQWLQQALQGNTPRNLRNDDQDYQQQRMTQNNGYDRDKDASQRQ